ncbi:hypothetical protein JZ751_024910 [Albula glossodonta]|uniref:Uncharacterized protein n=1 Tax=Albula glossodonta TaxID=121402 RepID=A0A8T2PIP2_9TELE|nr:hypothetical protein JZ751_024910 [Albula glossodonta]
MSCCPLGSVLFVSCVSVDTVLVEQRQLGLMDVTHIEGGGVAQSSPEGLWYGERKPYMAPSGLSPPPPTPPHRRFRG